MRTKTITTSLAAALAAIGAGGLLAGCGDNILDSDTPTIDADTTPPVDAEDGPDATPPDAAPPDADNRPTVGGTIAVNDVTLTTPGTNGLWRGPGVRVSFTDLLTGGGEVVFGTSPINGCLITQFDAEAPPNPSIDGGTVTIANDPVSEDPATGLLKTVAPCTFSAAANQYVCPTAPVTSATVQASDNSNGTVTYVFPGTDFSALKLVGSALNINGFTTDTTFNSGASAFPIVAQPSAPSNALVVLNTAPADAAIDTATGSATYLFFTAASPVPAGPGADFLGANGKGTAGNDVRITKPDTAVWPEIDVVVDVPGDGWELDAASTLPHEFPLTGTAADVRFGCDNNTSDVSDDTCGDAGSGALSAFIISGRATKRSVTGLLPWQMPTEVPGSTSSWLEFQCSGLLAKEMTMPAAAVQVIQDFAPTRVEVQVLNVAGNLLVDGNNQARVLVGHGFAGHTTPAAP